MPSYKYLILGGGMTGDAALHGIREVDGSGRIGLIGAEPHQPYDRPPLTKGLWKGKPLDSIWRETDAKKTTLHVGRFARRLDPESRSVTDDQGTVYHYEKLLLATGATPRRLPFGGDEIIYFRTLDDYQRLRALTENHQRFAVIGGGFIGWEIAAALAMSGKKVVMIFPGAGIGARLFTIDDWKEPFHEGVVYYLRAGRVRGVLLWNVWEQVDAARELIAEQGPFDAASLKGRLPA